jgi:hypothetical protein
LGILVNNCSNLHTESASRLKIGPKLSKCTILIE